MRVIWKSFVRSIAEPSERGERRGRAPSGDPWFLELGDKPGSLRPITDTYLFHDRLSFISGRDYLGAVVKLPDEESFARHKDVWKIDSGLLQFLLQASKLRHNNQFLHVDVDRQIVCIAAKEFA